MNNILLLINENLPDSIRNLEDNNEFHFVKEFIKPSPNETDNYDVFISNRLESIFTNNEFVLIIIPLSLSEENYMEYTGLRAAMHIRLTPYWMHSMKPILFLGPDSRDEVMNFSSLGEILYTDDVYLINEVCSSNIYDYIKTITEKRDSTDDSYNSFLRKVRVQAPANYASHHTVANEWAIIRWTSLFSWKDYTEPHIENKKFISMLYYKYIKACSDHLNPKQSQNISNKDRKKNPREPRIPYIEGSRIMYIDDEGDKGWNILLKQIFNNSKAEFITCPVNKELPKAQMIHEVLEFIKGNPNIDCYIIDLRLHIDDYSCEYNDLSGCQIAKIIKETKGNQIVVFTASNKVWNLKHLLFDIQVTGYAIKESPESNFSRSETYSSWLDFSKSVHDSVCLSYTKELYETIDRLTQIYPECKILENIIDLIQIDHNKNDNNIIRTSLISVVAFLEKYMWKKFSINSDSIIEKKSNTNYDYKELLFFKREAIKDSNRKKVVGYKVFPNKVECPSGYAIPSSDSDLSILVIPAILHYKLPESDVNFLIDMKEERNAIAHGAPTTKMTFKDIKRFISNIISPIIIKN